MQTGPNATAPIANASRRGFLRTGAAALVGLGLSSLPWLGGCAPLKTLHATDWQQLQARLAGPLLRPGSAGFEQRALPWALQYAGLLPAGIAQCSSEADVQTCLQWAQRNRLPLVARSGGHSYAGYSTTEGLMIDVSAMNGVAIDASTGIARLQGGARNKHVYAAARPLQRAITHGRCKDVGVAGLVLGGGIGFNMRAHGLTCDQLLSTRIVLADGRIAQCSDTENRDLFWACRGAGGGNFGIHTEFTFQTFPVGLYSVFLIKWSAHLAAAFATIQEWAMAAPEALGMKLSIVASHQPGSPPLQLSILGQWAGAARELDALLAPLLAAQPPDSVHVEDMAYWDAQEFLSEDGRPEYSHERSRFVRGALSKAAISTILDRLQQWPGTGVAATWKFFLMGGRIDAMAPSAMAFVHRGYSMISSIELEWLESDQGALLERNQQWLDRFHADMEPFTSASCYQNFIDPSQRDYLNAYYDGNLLALRRIKSAYDPTNLFNYPQSIPPL